MSTKLIDAAWEDRQLTATEKLIMLRLGDLANHYHGTAWPSVPTIARDCALGERTVQGTLKRLLAAGKLKVSRPATAHQSTVYVVYPGRGAESAPQHLGGATDGKQGRSSQQIRGAAAAPDPYIDPKLEPQSTNNKKGLTPEGLMALWNEHAGVLPKKRILSASERRAARARLAEVAAKFAECGYADESAFWRACIQALAASPHHTGQNDRGWVARFEFLTRENTWVRFAENTLRIAQKPATSAGGASGARGAQQAIRDGNVAHVAAGAFYKPSEDEA